MSFLLPKILETGKNVFISNSHIITIKIYYEKSTIEMWQKIIDDHRVSSVLVIFNNFLLVDATDRSKIRSDQKRFFIALSKTRKKHKTLQILGFYH